MNPGLLLCLLLFFALPVFQVAQDDSAPPKPDTRPVNTVGKAMPPDAAPLARQVYSFHLPEPTTLDIGIAVYEATGAVFSFEGLTRPDHNNELMPAAAERWESSPDGTRWIFHLRTGAKWSDGRPVTAHDFEYAFKRMVDPASANRNASFYYEIEGAKAFHQGLTRDAGSVGVRAVDDHTLVIQTALPCPYLPYIASFPASVPVPRWQVEKYGPGWSEPGRFVTNSTFKLDAWDHGSRFEFVLDPNYNGTPQGIRGASPRTWAPCFSTTARRPPCENHGSKASKRIGTANTPSGATTRAISTSISERPGASGTPRAALTVSV